MFRAPCMSQRRLALIFCVSVLIVLIVALILLCECRLHPRCVSAGWGGSGLGGRLPGRHPAGEGREAEQR